MESEISLSEFTSNIELVKTYIAEASHKSVTRIEYRTFDEGMCGADIFVIDKDKVHHKFEAFVTLCTFYLHSKEWPLTDINSKSADTIFKLWMLTEVEAYTFEALSIEQIHGQINWVIGEILKLLADYKGSKETDQYPDLWGVYVNDEAIPIDSTLDDLGLGEILSGIGLDLKWNSVEIMYETPSSYVFFSWETGA
jgi:hypothetical protein